MCWVGCRMRGEPFRVTRHWLKEQVVLCESCLLLQDVLVQVGHIVGGAIPCGKPGLVLIVPVVDGVGYGSGVGKW